MRSKKWNAIISYVIAAYLLFWVVILVFGGLASVVFQAPPLVMQMITILGSWTPTLALLLLLHKILPEFTIRSFFKKVFNKKIPFCIVLLLAILIFGCTFVAAYLVALYTRSELGLQLSIPSALTGILLLTVFQGPGGEEAGWRGYLRPELEGQLGFLSGNIILGLVWAFWHAPLWFLTSDFVGVSLLLYILSNIVVLTSVTLIMGVVMHRYDNLFLAFWIHFCFNVSLRFLAEGIEIYLALSLIYFLVALVMVVFQKNRRLC